MEDMATGEIRLSILWEWLHKNAAFTADDDQVGVKAGDRFTPELLPAAPRRGVREAPQRQQPRRSRRRRRHTTLPIAREIVEAYVMDDVKLPWYIDLLNINLDNHDLAEARRRIRLLAEAFRKDGTRDHREPGLRGDRVAFKPPRAPRRIDYSA